MLTIDNKAWQARLLAEGVAKGKAEALIWLLAERFGAVAPSRQKRIRGARLATLERRFKRAIVAPGSQSWHRSSIVLFAVRHDKELSSGILEERIDYVKRTAFNCGDGFCGRAAAVVLCVVDCTIENEPVQMSG
jgi:hypothetical protein